MNIQGNPFQSHLRRWQSELSDSLETVDQLFEAGLVSRTEAERLRALGQRFKIRITPYYAALIANSPACPIRKQAIPDLGEHDPVLPEWAELASIKVYGRPVPWDSDPIGDLDHLNAPRLTHRYGNRVLIHLSSTCAVYCRFCFRKSHLNNKEKSLYSGALDSAFQYLEAHPEVSEVILTGGDPLAFQNHSIEQTFERLNQISSVRVVRIHTRMAVTLPCRFDQGLVDVLGRDWRFSVTLASHFNHPAELTPEALGALKALRRAGITLLNQTVLLKGVNDSVACLKDLFQSLYEAGVLPFYLHHPDWTPGTFHFRTSIEEGRKLMRQLRGVVSGPALPDYVLDIPGGFGKVSLMGESVRKIEDYGNPDIEQNIYGALYCVDSPLTRSEMGKSILYLDLF